MTLTDNISVITIGVISIFTMATIIAVGDEKIDATDYVTYSEFLSSEDGTRRIDADEDIIIDASGIAPTIESVQDGLNLLKFQHSVYDMLMKFNDPRALDRNLANIRGGFRKITKRLITLNSSTTDNPVFDWLNSSCPSLPIEAGTPFQYASNNKSFKAKTLYTHFIIACSNGHPLVADWLLSTGCFDVDEDLYFKAITASAKNGHKSTLEWLHSTFGYSGGDIRTFTELCCNNDLEMARFLYDMWPSYIPVHANTVMYMYCVSDQMKTCAMLEFIYSLNPDLIKGGFQTHFNNMCEQMAMVVDIRDVDCIAWAYIIGGDDVTVSFSVFKKVCNFGYLDLAIYLYSTGDISLDDLPSLFVSLCGTSYSLSSPSLPVLQWMAGLDGFDYTPLLQDGFKEACRRGILITAQWIYSLGEIDIHIQNDHLFSIVCGTGNVDFARWFYELDGEVNVHTPDVPTVDDFLDTTFDPTDSALLHACYSTLEMAQWVYSLDEFDIHRFNNRLIRRVCMAIPRYESSLDILEWIYSLDTPETFDLAGDDYSLYREIQRCARMSDCNGGMFEWLSERSAAPPSP